MGEGGEQMEDIGRCDLLVRGRRAEVDHSVLSVIDIHA